MSAPCKQYLLTCTFLPGVTQGFSLLGNTTGSNTGLPNGRLCLPAYFQRLPEANANKFRPLIWASAGQSMVTMELEAPDQTWKGTGGGENAAAADKSHTDLLNDGVIPPDRKGARGMLARCVQRALTRGLLFDFASISVGQ